MYRPASLALLCLLAGAARAEPWLAPGDAVLRHDLSLLADAGVLHGPISTWPLSWPDIARDVADARVDALDAVTQRALQRVQRRARAASGNGFAGAGVRASASKDPTPFRGFADTPREEGEVAGRAGWQGDHVALNLQATYALDPQDGRKVRADGSYLGVNIANFMFSAGYLDRWWGPGWDGSLILSTNARPMPGVSIERNYSDAFETKLLSWLGPWRAVVSMSQAEEHDVAVPNVRFFAARLNFKPRPWLEIGLSRTAQWCGTGRPCDLGTLGDLLVGRDNAGDDEVTTADEAGNQMAGYDARLRSPWRALPLVVYTQWIGEDEAGGLPSKFLGLFGAEVWGGGDYGSWRLRGEYADTTCAFTQQDAQFDCAYRNALYSQGYTHRGRLLGHSVDNDSRMTSAEALWARPGGDAWMLSMRKIDLNRDGGPHAISDVPRKINDVELRYSRDLGAGRISGAVGYGDGSSINDNSALRGFLTWQQGF
jgi:hypothetical protein